MTESNNLPVVEGEELNSPVQNVIPAPEVVSREPIPEKTLTQSEVNDLMGRTKQNFYEKGYSKAQEELKATQTAAKPAETPNASPDIQALVKSELEKQRQEYAQQAEAAGQQAQMEKLVGELTTKVNDAKSRYSDYDEVTAGVDFSQIPDVLMFANAADNAGDVLYELAKNPAKIGMIRSLASTPQLAQRSIMDLSNSIKMNQSAKGQKFPNDPLNQMKPSNVGNGDGPPSLAELKRKYTV